MSIIQSIKDAASLGLKPDGLEGAIVRYGDQAKFLPMYVGYKIRMMRSGHVIAVNAKTVYTEDEFDYWETPRGTAFTHHPAKARKDPETGEQRVSRGAYMGFYAYARRPEDTDAVSYFRYMDVDQVNKIRDQYGTKNGPWATNYEPMALKTVIRALRNDVPQEANSTDPLTLIERKNDEAQAALRAASTRLDDGLSEVRDLALRAVGALPAGGDASPDEAAGGSADPATAEEAVGPDGEILVPTGAPEGSEGDGWVPKASAPTTAPDPGQDPDVRAAMKLAAEQEQLARQRKGQR